ncbi:hypothetical protein GEMRC1_008011 [Eukaryota sp. GEM-RC1]
MSDLITPDRKKFVILLSALLNFAKFREDQLSKYAELEHTTVSLEEELELLKTQEAEVLQHVHELEDQEKAEEPELIEVENNIKTLTEQLKSFHGDYQALSSETTLCKQENADLETEIESLKLKTITVEQEVDVLSGKVKDDPTTLRDHISEIERKAEALNDSLASEQSRFKVIQDKQKLLNEISRQLPKFNKILEKIKNIIKKKSSLADKIYSSSIGAAETEKEVEGVDLKIRHFDKKIAQFTDQMKRSQDSHELKKEGYSSRRKELLDSIRKERQSKGDIMKTCTDLENDIQSRRSKLQELSESRDLELREVSSIVEQVEKTVTAWHARLSAEMQETNL